MKKSSFIVITLVIAAGSLYYIQLSQPGNPGSETTSFQAKTEQKLEPPNPPPVVDGTRGHLPATSQHQPTEARNKEYYKVDEPLSEQEEAEFFGELQSVFLEQYPNAVDLWEQHVTTLKSLGTFQIRID